MSLYRELDDLTLDQLIEQFQGPPNDGKQYCALFYADVAHRIRERGEAGVAFLLAERERIEGDADRLRAALDALAIVPGHEHPELASIYRSYLRDRRGLVVMEAVDGLRLWQVRDAHEEVAALRRHRSPYVRGAVIRYLQDLFPDEAIPLALASLQDRHFVVRESAIDALDALDAIGALDAMRPLRDDPHPHVREAAQWAVERFEAPDGDADRKHV
jgi:HEAT repeat protein